MKNQTLTFSSIVLLFFMLWAPLGQYEFLIEHWMKIGNFAMLIAWSVIPAVLFTVPSNVPQAVGATHGN